MRAILIVSHGSHSPKTKLEIEALVDALIKRKLVDVIEFAFLEIEKPSIPKGIESLAKKSARNIKILLNFLNSGRHVNVDIPKIVNNAKKKHPHIQFSISPPVGQHPKIVDLFCDLVVKNP